MPAIAEAYVEIHSDVRELTPEVKRAAENAAEAAERALGKIRGPDGQFISKGIREGLAEAELHANRTGESIENAFLEAGRASERHLRGIGDVSTFAPAAVSAEISAEKIERSFRDAGNKSERSLSGIGQSLALVGAAAGAALGAITVFGVKSAAQLEQTEIAFEGLLGSAEEAGEFIKDLQQFAATTPFEFQGLATAGRQLLGVGFAAADIIPTLTTLGDVASTLGVPQENIQGIITAIGQIRGLGRVTADNLNQISNQLPGFNARQAISIGLQREMGITAAEASDLMEKGAVDAETGIRLLLGAMEEFPGAAGAMARQATTLTGLLSTFKDTVELTLIDAFEPLVDVLKEQIPDATSVVEGALQRIAPVLSGLVEAAIPIIFELVDTLGGLFETLGPSLVHLLEASQPAVTAFLAVIEGFAPILAVVADVLASIPEPIFTMAGAFVVGGLALKTFNGVMAATTGRILGTKLALSAFNPIVLAVTAAITIATLAIGQNAEAERKRKQRIDETRSALEEAIPTEEAFRKQTEALAEENEGFAQDLRDAGLTVDEYLRILREEGIETLTGFAAAERFGAESVIDGNIALIGQARALEEAAKAELEAGVATGRWTHEQTLAAQEATRRDDGTTNLVAALASLRDEELRAEAQTKRVREEGDLLARGFLDVAGTFERVGQESEAVVGSLDNLREKTKNTDQSFLDLAFTLDAAALSEEGFKDVAALLGVEAVALQGFVEDVTEAIDEFASTATSQLPDVANVFADALQGIENAAQSTAGVIREGATARIAELEEASRSSVEAQTDAIREAVEQQTDELKRVADERIDELQAQAEANGTKVSEAEVAAIRQSTEDQIEALKNGADSQVQTVEEERARITEAEIEAIRTGAEDQATEIERSGVITAAALAASFKRQANEIRDFRLDLQALTEGGFEELAAIIAEQGPEIGAPLADELRNAMEGGNEEILIGLQNAANAFEREWTSTTEFFRTTLGPQFILASGLLGEAAAAAFGDGLSFDERVRIASALAKSGLTIEGQGIAAVAAVEGERVAREYGQALGLDEQTINEAVRAGVALQQNAPVDAGWIAGTSVGGAYVGGLGSVGGNAWWIGTQIGDAFSNGVATGIQNSGANAVQAALKLAEKIRRALADALDIFSPSGVTEEMGRQLVQGFDVGIIGAAPNLDRSLGVLAQELTNAFPTTVAGDTGRNDRGGTIGETNITFAAGSVVVEFAGTTPTVEEARRTGNAVGAGIADVLARRRIGLIGRTA